MTDPIGFSLADGLSLSGVDVEEVWCRYAANGGLAGFSQFVDRVQSRTRCDAAEHDLIAQTLNECFLDAGVTGFPVRYRNPPVVLPAPPQAGPHLDTDGPRRRAAEARLRSAMAARQAALLHLTAARLMQRSGQIAFASRAQQRATRSNERFSSLVANG